MRAIATSLGCLPVVCAGDIFDRWDSPPELINFALDTLPHVYAVPGQHDLPNHNYKEIHRSAYWTLVLAGKITTLRPGVRKRVNECLTLYGYPWGYWPTKKEPELTSASATRLAVIHHYCWRQGNSYEGASEQNHISQVVNYGFDAFHFADNHKGFLDASDRPYVFNGGTLVRRRSDERDYKPRVGILYADGHIENRFLDTSQDKFVSDDEMLAAVAEEFHIDPGKLIAEIESMTDTGISFKEAVKVYTHGTNVDQNLAKWLLKWVENH